MKQTQRPVRDRWLDVDEVRLVADLRIMHAKVDELYQFVTNLRRRQHSESDTVRYADKSALSQNITKVDEIYVWFVKLKKEAEKRDRRL
jgi:membrane-bound lytic murein transglycosylase MltF